MFPICVHVNGPGETAYFAQLQPAFGASGVSTPLVHLRPSLSILRPKERKLFDAMGLYDDRALARPETWPPLVEKADTGDESSLQDAKDSMMRALEALQSWAGEAARGITAPYLQKTLEGWDRSLLAINKQRDQESKAARRQRRHLEHWLWPHQQLQERVLSPLTLFQDRAPELLGPILSTMDIYARGHQLVDLSDADMEDRT
jgi:uncharacterized protein YllA (UPF0747 family)